MDGRLKKIRDWGIPALTGAMWRCTFEWLRRIHTSTQSIFRVYSIVSCCQQIRRLGCLGRATQQRRRGLHQRPELAAPIPYAGHPPYGRCSENDSRTQGADLSRLLGKVGRLTATQPILALHNCHHYLYQERAYRQPITSDCVSDILVGLFPCVPPVSHRERHVQCQLRRSLRDDGQRDS